ncbi:MULTISPECIES: BlaI/MecI/CopY family transcriptional regulator [unclassified Frankia]|uniref:BlaI/MecI/CopY family transcriptional regulator n=1 Tax=unclassified Frankia TaxID=2632575 RepID=UPI0018E9F46D|nr:MULTISPECIES: BlaI/MecI/CopY family transcriptional regulator [unclassified Frankia]
MTMMMAGDRRAPGDLERTVMETLRSAARPLTPREVQNLLGGDLAYTTVLTILTRLYDKGLLDRQRAGRAHAYSPVTDEAGMTVRRLHQVLDEAPGREIVLARFLGSLSRRDGQLVREMLRELDARQAPDEGA